MTKFNKLRLGIFEAYYENTISDTEEKYLLAVLEASEKKEKLFSKENIDKFVDKQYKGMNQRADKIASKLTRKPKSNARNIYPKDQYEKYQAAMNRWKTAYKIGEMAVVGFIIPKPVDIIINAALIGKMASSDDPSDKAVKETIDKVKGLGKKLKDKWTDFINKFKGKTVDPATIKSQINSLDAQGASLARQMDSINKRVHAGAISESVDYYNKSASNTIFKEKTYNEFIDFLSVYEFTNPTLNTIIDYYLENTTFAA